MRLPEFEFLIAEKPRPVAGVSLTVDFAVMAGRSRPGKGSVGLFSSRKSESLSVDELLSMKDSEINKVLRGKKDVPYRSAKELRAAARQDRRAFEGEKGVGAMLDGMRGGGARNYQNVPLKDRVHPAEYQRILAREAKRQGLL